MRILEGSSRGKRNLETLLAEISQSVPDKDRLRADVNKYLETDVKVLPAFLEDGSVAFYEVAGILLGKSALIKFIEQCK